MDALVQDMKSVAGVQDVHDLHVWCIASGMYALSCHAIITDQSTSESISILRSLERMLLEKYRIGHSTIQCECQTHQHRYCSVEGLYCQMEAGGHDHDHDHSSIAEQEQRVNPKGG